MAFNSDYGSTPRNYFVNQLTSVVFDVKSKIFDQRASVVDVFPAMKGIIATLNAESQNDLKEIVNDIDAWRANQKRYSKKEIEDTFFKIVAYLHTGYLKEVNWVKPRFATTELDYEREKAP